MSWASKWKGKYVTIDPDHPNALGDCDDSGFTFNHKDLCKQMEWRGNSLVWTGFLVGKPYLDEPNEQNRPPKGGTDPKPIINPRPPAYYLDPESNPIESYKKVLAELERESFYSTSQLPDSNYNEEPDPNRLPDNKIVENELRKVTFNG